MSQTLTVTTTTTTTESSKRINNNARYIKSKPGLLKLLQLVLGIVTVGLVSYYIDKYIRFINVPELFFLLMAVTFLALTFILLISCVISRTTSSFVGKTVYEVVYHGFAAILLLVASLTFIIEIHRKKENYGEDYDSYLAAAIIGLVNSILYLLSTLSALKTYRGN